MSATNASSARKSFREEIAERFVGVLEAKGADWVKEWGTRAPHNPVTGVTYHGVNALNLMMVQSSRGYDDPRWVTFTQIADEGGISHPGQKWHLLKGSKSVPVEFWTPVDTKTGKEISWKKYHELLKGDDKTPPRKEEEFDLAVHYYKVFNASCIEGMPPLERSGEAKVSAPSVLQTAEAIGVGLSFGGGNAFYSPKEDSVAIPCPDDFFSEEAFVSTAMHELVHATGHKSRLDRHLGGSFGSEGYAREELVAEIGSVFLSWETGVAPTEENLKNHEAYIAGWVQAIREKPSVLSVAIKDAEKAADYIVSATSSASN